MNYSPNKMSAMALRNLQKWYWRIHRARRNFEHAIRSKRALKNGAKTAHFLHINKAAGSAVKETLFSHRITEQYVLKLHTHDTTLEDVPKGEKFFFFLRDPVSRFVSGFNQQLNRGAPKYETEWSEEEEKVFSAFDSAEKIALALSSRDESLRKLAETGMKCINHVRTFYSDWFISDEYFESRIEDLLFIGFQEHMDRDFAMLSKLLGLPKDTTLPNDPVMANKSEVLQHGRYENRKKLSSLAMHNISQWYAKDIDFYNKCTELARTCWRQD